MILRLPQVFRTQYSEGLKIPAPAQITIFLYMMLPLANIIHEKLVTNSSTYPKNYRKRQHLEDVFLQPIELPFITFKITNSEKNGGPLWMRLSCHLYATTLRTEKQLFAIIPPVNLGCELPRKYIVDYIYI